jgi:hypothetical protein
VDVVKHTVPDNNKEDLTLKIKEVKICVMRNFIICTHQIMLGWSDQGRSKGTYMEKEKCIHVLVVKLERVTWKTQKQMGEYYQNRS